MNAKKILITTLFTAVFACGGSDKKSNGPTPGTTHSSPDSKNSDIEDIGMHKQPVGHLTQADAGMASPDSDPIATPGALVTFVIKNNKKDSELTLNMDKGWQGVFLAYSGTPPNAKPMLLFPTHCTASCDSSKADVCPYCPEPTRVKEIKANENHDDIAPGETREIPWSGDSFSYKKAKGTRNGKRNTSCNCYEEVAPPPGTYTVQACGLRKTKKAKQRSGYPCVKATMTWPVTEPTRIEFNFDE